MSPSFTPRNFDLVIGCVDRGALRGLIRVQISRDHFELAPSAELHDGEWIDSIPEEPRRPSVAEIVKSPGLELEELLPLETESIRGAIR